MVLPQWTVTETDETTTLPSEVITLGTISIITTKGHFSKYCGIPLNVLFTSLTCSGTWTDYECTDRNFQGYLGKTEMSIYP